MRLSRVDLECTELVLEHAVPVPDEHWDTRRLMEAFDVLGDPAGLEEVDDWLAPFRHVWDRHLDALATEVARGKRKRRRPKATRQGDS